MARALPQKSHASSGPQCPRSTMMTDSEVPFWSSPSMTGFKLSRRLPLIGTQFSVFLPDYNLGISGGLATFAGLVFRWGAMLLLPFDLGMT